MSTLSVPLITDEDDTLSAALAYAGTGLYIVPIASGSKSPGSVLGKGWQHQSSRDPDKLHEWFIGTSHGIALHVGRSGAVVLDIDNPEAMPQVIMDAIVAASPPFQRTRPEHTGLRGHFLFDAEGVSYSNSTGTTGHEWGDVRGANGVVVVAPTVHPDNGRYEWVQTGALPPVPAALAAQLRHAGPTVDAATDSAVAAFLAAHGDSERPTLLDAIDQRLAAAKHPGRHQAAVSAACQAAREAMAGYFSAQEALERLGKTFAAVTPERDTRDEWRGIVAWAVAQTRGVDPEQVRREVESRTRTELAPLDNGFWEQRDSLRHIRDAAWSREASPEAVLGLTLARLSGMQSAKLDIGKGPTGLNLFTAAIGPSGAGKSVASEATQDLIPARPAQDFLDALPVGSGEGLAEAYMGQVPIDPADPKKTKRGQVRQYAYVYIDEGQVLDQLTERQGSTLAMNLRQAFSCSTLGQQNASEDRTRIVTSYSLGLGIAFQPPMIRKLFADVDGGTPQRFLLTDAVARDLPDDDVPWPGALCPEDAPEMWPTHVTGLVGFDLPDVKAELRAKRRAIRRGDVDQDPFDAHADLIRARVAALLAILDGRASVHRDDWRIAGQVMAQSTALRDQLRGEHVAEDQAREEHATEQAASRAAALSNHDRKLNRVARLLIKHATEGMTRSQLLHKLHSRDHGHFEAALPRAMDDGGFEFDDEDRVRL